jgi:hypothetical protein
MLSSETGNPTRLMQCPLCESVGCSTLFHSDKNRKYHRCSICDLIFVPPSQLLSWEAEKAEYDKHQNSPDDLGYRNFLSRLFLPIQERIDSGSHGLDFGSGPGPALSVMFEEEGHRVRLFDPFYAPDTEPLTGKYDFITASEVVEHLHNPAEEFELLWSLLKSGGWLGIMTKLALDKTAFAKWHYKNDPTHVRFFSKKTMEWLGEKWQAKPVQIGSDVILFQKLH